MSISVRVPSIPHDRRPEGRISDRKGLSRRLLAPAVLSLVAGLVAAADIAEAKRPGSTYCFHGTCHRVKTLSEMRSLIGKDVLLHASHYGHCSEDRFNPCGLTSSGSRYEPQRPDNAASPIYPDGTRLLVFNPATGAAAMIRINNAGPYWGNRKLDVSRATADKLGFKSRGVAQLQTRVISAPDRRESTYVRNRRYESVAGYIGRFASIDDAEQALAAVMAVRAMAASAIAPVTGGVIAAAHAEPVSAEARRRELAKKVASRIAKLAPPPPRPLKAADARLAIANRDGTAEKAPAPPVRETKATVVAARTPQPEEAPVASAAPVAPETAKPSRAVAVAAAVPLPALGPPRWRIRAERAPPLPEGKPTRLADARRDVDLDDLAWQLEQVLIERHFTHQRADTGRDMVGDMDDSPFSPEPDDRSDTRALPISNEARAGRMG